MPVEDKEVDRTRAREEFWCHHPEVTIKAMSPSIREKTYRERNNGPRRVFQPCLEVRKRKKSNPGDKMKTIKISAELYRSKEERILRKSSCGQQSRGQSE